MKVVIDHNKFSQAIHYVASKNGKGVCKFLKDNKLRPDLAWYFGRQKSRLNLGLFNDICNRFGINPFRFITTDKKLKKNSKFIPELDMIHKESKDTLPDIEFDKLDRDTYFFVISKTCTYLKIKYPYINVQALIRPTVSTQTDIVDIEIVKDVHIYIRFYLDSKGKVYSCLDISDKYTKDDPSLIKISYSEFNKEMLESYCKTIERERLIYKCL